MKGELSAILLAIICILCFDNVHAQGGGPPMLTDDPGTPDVGHWEINTSINSQVTKDIQLAVPYIDANYGAAKGLQLKIETPYLITFDHKNTSGKFGDPLLGVKYRFMNEEKNFVSVSVYPQATITGNQKGFLLPFQFEKTLGRFVIGEDIGYFFVEKDSNNILNGTLLAYKISGKLQVLGEYFMEKSYSPAIATEGFMNYGFRYEVNKIFTFMGSFGTQVVTPANVQRQYFFSFLGIQSVF